MLHRVLIFVVWTFAVASSMTLADDVAPDFSREVAPIFRKYCNGCHNDDDRDGDLSLESFASLQKGGENGPALLPGNASSSRLLRMMTGAVKTRMPPEDEVQPTAADIELLRRWIEMGAKGPSGAEPDRTQLLTPKISAAKGAKPITALACSPDGKMLAVTRFENIELVDIATQETVRTIVGDPGKIHSASFSSDGKLLLTASGVAGLYGKATLWTVADGKPLRSFQGHRDTLYDAAMSPDGKTIATCSYDRNIMLWDADTGQQLRSLAGHNDAVYDVAFSPDSRVLVSASGDETCKVWQVSTGRRLDTLGQPLAEQFTVHFTPDGRHIVAGGADNRIRVWRFVSKKRPRINPLVHARFGHEAAIVQSAISHDGDWLVTIAADRTVKLWNTKSFTQSQAFPTQVDEAQALAMHPDGKSFFVGRMDGSLSRYNIRSTQSGSPTTTNVTAVETMPPDGDMNSFNESEPNNSPAQANAVELPTVIVGHIQASANGTTSDEDFFRFKSKAGQQWMLEINAARSKSPLDSKIEVLKADGSPIVRTKLRAVRDSYFTFRGKDSSTSDDFRVHNWEEMELNEFLYANGEVVKLWLYPRGPDSGFKVYPGNGKRFGYFDTTATSHALHSPCYVVEPHPPTAELVPNGLPVFPVYFENDDDSLRQWGSDSRLLFTAPQDGEFLARVSDVRGFQGDKFKYSLTIRPRRPDYTVSLSGANPTVNAGSGKEFKVRANRTDGFDGEIRVDIEDVPPGFNVTSPVIIQAGQLEAFGTITADEDATAPESEIAKATKVTASAMIHGSKVTHAVNNLGAIKLAPKPKLLTRVVALDANVSEGSSAKPLELTISPGETISARVIVERNGFNGRISFGKEDSGRNLPHGVYVDNIGLNGLLIVEGKSEREFFLTAAKWVPATTRLFHLKANVEGGQTTLPIVLHVRNRDAK